MSEPDDNELHRMRRRVRQLQQALDEARAENRTLLGSHSFRLTAPLRWLRRRLDGDHPGTATAPSAGVTAATATPVTAADAAVAAFPAGFQVDPARPHGPNDSYRPLDFDAALQPLLGPRLADGRLRPPALPMGTRYYGTRPSPLRIATLAGAELNQELAFDAAVTPLRRTNWPEQLGEDSHDFLLIESSWEPEGGWGFALCGDEALRAPLLRLLRHCRDHHLPVVLWLREDARNYERFAWLAAEVDRAYAVDEDLRARLARDFPDLPVALLGPAVQPALYNPVRSYALRDSAAAVDRKVVFDGWWNLGGEAADAPVLAAMDKRLLVVDSEWDFSRVRWQERERHRGATLGALSPLEKSALSRNAAAEVFLPDPLLLPWRQATMMLRTAACGSSVFFQGEHASLLETAAVPHAASAGALPGLLEQAIADPLARMRQAHLAFREIFSRHCLADRLQRIAADLGITRAAADAPVRVAQILVTMRPEHLAACLVRFRAGTYPASELLVVLHGNALDATAARALLRPGEPVTVLQVGSERSLGDCLNFAIAHTDAPWWVKIDDDDHYGSHYVADMMLYRRAVDVPLMGKPPVFLHLEQGDELRWDPRWAAHANLLHTATEADSALVAGGTLAGRREVLDSVRFSPRRRGGSDSDFIHRCHEHGHDLLAVDGFNFARFRSATPGFHTWEVAAEGLRQRSLPLGGAGDLDQHVFI